MERAPDESRQRAHCKPAHRKGEQPRVVVFICVAWRRVSSHGVGRVTAQAPVCQTGDGSMAIRLLNVLQIPSNTGNIEAGLLMAPSWLSDLRERPDFGCRTAAKYLDFATSFHPPSRSRSSSQRIWSDSLRSQRGGDQRRLLSGNRHDDWPLSVGAERAIRRLSCSRIWQCRLRWMRQRDSASRDCALSSAGSASSPSLASKSVDARPARAERTRAIRLRQTCRCPPTVRPSVLRLQPVQ